MEDRLREFISMRGGSNSWAQTAWNVDAWRRRAPQDVRPLTLEFSPVLDCNADCPHCPYRRSRLSEGSRRIVERSAPPNPRTVASKIMTRRVLAAAAAAGVRGVLWTGGGEPTLLEDLDDACAYSNDLGMANAIYTNGILLGLNPALAGRLVLPRSGVVFIRISINAVSSSTVRAHWGVRDAESIGRQIAGLHELLEARAEVADLHSRHSLPSIQISTIVDRRNAGDLQAVCDLIGSVFAPYRAVRGAEDVMIVRPIIRTQTTRWPDDCYDPLAIATMLEVCGRDGGGRQAVEQSGLELRLGFGLDRLEGLETRDYSALIANECANRRPSYAHQLFLTVGPDGTVYPCMELNCDRRWMLGNLLEQTVDAIYHSEPFHDFVRMANTSRWGPPLFHPFSRTARLDRIADAIGSGELSDTDIETIRRQSLASHSLLLN